MPKNKSSVFAASVVAASATALSVSSSSPGFNSNVKEAGPNKDQQGSASMKKFAPRFDGLRLHGVTSICGWQKFCRSSRYGSIGSPKKKF
uniref:Uncharacterized protein n=1 Tax=Salix viminalis TaxID=40686 RepID=A0A6N2M2F3_SALVM